MLNTIVRNYPPHAFNNLIQHGYHPVLARIYAARGIEKPDQLEAEWPQLIPFSRLKNVSFMAARLADALVAQKRLLIVADYDSDGATACAVGIRALRKFGAMVDYLVPNRFEYGYGLTPEIVHLAADTLRPDILITVDNGIASVEGVAEANRRGIQVFITDHHLPGDKLPDAAVIVNPNQTGCGFHSKHLAGVGVMFYLLLALRGELRGRGRFAALQKEPNLASLLDLVALGTVADVVKLDDNNRILVHKGLQRIRSGRACAGIRALLEGARRDFRQVSAYELGFILGPRLNAAGRLDDMTLGIECLITDDAAHASRIVLQLDALNHKRREIEADMHNTAQGMLDNALSARHTHSTPAAKITTSLSLFDPRWHQGVIGILASRLKERLHRPVIAFAPGSEGELKGSGRSIPGLHLRDSLDLVSKRYPGLLLKFGGHAAAAGMTIRTSDFEKFREAFEEVARAMLTPADLQRVIETDGDLDEAEMNLELARQIGDQVWGQGFAQPTFITRFQVQDQRVVAERHLKLKLRRRPASAVSAEKKPSRMDSSYEAILFAHNGPLPEVIDAVYRIQVNEFKGNSTLQLVLDHWFQPDALNP